MTPAESAVNNAISFECKKDALQQRQSGDWKISFTVQGIDMDDRITKAPMGTRFVAVLVAINDDESPVQQPAKEKKHEAALSAPSPRRLDKPAGAKWQEMKPQQQAGMRCQEPIFWAYLNEEHGYRVTNKEEAAEAVREKCVVKSRSMLDDPKHHASRTIWHQLDSGYLAWKALEHA